MLFSTFLWHKYTATWPVSYRATILSKQPSKQILCFCRTVCFQHHTNYRLMLLFSGNDECNEVLIWIKCSVFHIHLKALHTLRLLTPYGVLMLIFMLFCNFTHISWNFLSIISASFRCCYLWPARWNFSQLYSALLFLHRFPPSLFACSSVLSQP